MKVNDRMQIKYTQPENDQNENDQIFAEDNFKDSLLIELL